MRLVQGLVRGLVAILVRLFYPRMAVEGGAQIPGSGPVIFVLNHPNGLLDPLVLWLAVGRPVRFLAKNTMFGNPLGRLAMTAFGSIPVYRQRDVAPGAASTPQSSAVRNEQSFAVCRQALARGEWMALFPEGTSHSDPQLKPLKTGAARIALSAEREYGDTHGTALGVTIIPVGLEYERKARFRSGVLLLVGSPLAVTPRLPGYMSDERSAVEALTDDIRAALDEVVLQAETRDLLAGVERVASWTVGDEGNAADIAAHNRRARQMLDGYRALAKRDPARVELIAADARDYARTLRRLGVRDPWALEFEVVSPARAIRAAAGLAVTAPVALVGALLGWLPYRLAVPAAARITSEEDLEGTVKLLVGSLFLLLAWLGEAALAGFVFAPAWALLPLVVGPAAGYVALRFDEAWSDTREALRHVWLRAVHFDKIRRLADHRRALADDIARALAELAP